MTDFDGLAHYPLPLDRVPPDWAVASVGDLSVSVEPGFASGEHNLTGDGLPHIRPMNVTRAGTIDLQGVKSVPPGKSDKRLLLGDVVFNNTNSPPLVGKTAVFRREGDFGFSNHMTRITPTAGISPEFLAYQLHYLWSAGYFRHLCTNHVNQASVSSIRLAKAVPVLAPPLAEQERIVAAIDEHFSHLDAADGLLDRVERNLSRLWRADLAKAFSSEWPRRVLAEMTSPDRPICYGILKPRTDRPGKVPYVEVRSIKDGQIDIKSLHLTTEELHAEFRRSELAGGDVVLAIRGSWDRAAVVPDALAGANVSRDVARIAPKPEHLDSRYLALFLQGPEAARYFGKHARGVAVKGVNIGDLRKLPIPSPSLPEQARLVELAEGKHIMIDRARREVVRARTQGRSLRWAVLYAAFAGRLVPQDHAKEPASAPASERIRQGAPGEKPPAREKTLG